LLPGNDDVAGVPANIDNIPEIGRGEVVEFAWLMLLQRALLILAAFGILEPAVFFLDIVLSSIFTVSVAPRACSDNP
jgi:hypothetical protein